MSTAGKIKEKPKQEFQPVLCDMCVDTQVPALKTCLKCEISMCAQHLQAHLTTPVLLQTHPLTKPTTPGGLSSGAVRCPEHGKLLEYYCLDDRTCVCVSCSIEDQHRLHNMKSLPNAHKVLVEKLREELKALAEREKQGKALKSWETKQTKALEVSTEYLVKRVLALRDIGLNKVQSSVTARLGAIQTARQNIEAALSEEDAHMFLQRFAGVHEAVEKARAVDFIHGLEEEVEPTEVRSDILKNGHQVMEKVRKLQRDLLVLVNPDNHTWVRNKSTDVSFDPQTIGQHFFLSSDFKMLSCRSPIGYFSQRVYLQNGTNGDLYWTIQFSDKYDWSVGIGDKNFPSEVWLNGPLYGLEWKNNQYSELTSQLDKQGQFNLVCKVLTHSPKFNSPQVKDFQGKLEVLWDSSTRSLSFFTRDEYDEMICLHSVDIDSSLSQELFPFVTLEKREKGQPNHSGYRDSHFGYGGSPQYVDFLCALEDQRLDRSRPQRKEK
ncbi:E3 ubiquitin-protein ligase Midline-1-like [Alosa pseudoharengus]|uniref:E3 ubiquitin-protein ligase Midline-1-like n=1 Tax=Alosa pseudoharengus TaxID=34774 RepID=UPI003F8C53A1